MKTGRKAAMRAAVSISAVLVLAGATGGCASAAPPELVRIVDTGLSGAQFEPSALVVPRGTEVRWRNSGARVQVVVSLEDMPADAAPWDSGPLRAGETFSHRFDVPGTYVYRGPEDDANMIGTIEVQP